MEVPYSPGEFRDAIFETIRANGFDACYIRPVVYRGLGALGVNPFHSPVEVMIAVWNWGKYLGDEALEGGVDVCVSSWNRMAPNTFPAMAKATGNYLNSRPDQDGGDHQRLHRGHRPRQRRPRSPRAAARTSSSSTAAAS